MAEEKQKEKTQTHLEIADITIIANENLSKVEKVANRLVKKNLRYLLLSKKLKLIGSYIG